ncbi:MAG: CotH kinase family protein [Salinivirgaceae bacterium]|jgi:hypothetical protein|nr:CotH kinase family protein [Salinivirgaceae bacterium]
MTIYQALKTLTLILSALFILNITIAQNIIINEFSSLNTLILDEDNDTPDWFELHNYSSESINIGNFSISDDSSNLTKWVFPEIELTPDAYLLIYTSGKDRKTETYYRNLINKGDTFEYAIGSDDISANWKNLNFDASSWEKGPSGFGFGDGDDETLLDNGTLSIFVRKTFNISEISSLEQLILHMDYDDGFVAHINGFEVARANLGSPNSEVPYNQTTDNNHEALLITGQTPELFIIDNFENFLTTGENILTVQGHNTSSTSSDLSLVPFLSANYNTPVAGKPMPDILNIKNQALHTNFKISSDGEKLYLSNASGVIIDETDSITLPPDISYGRTIGNNTKWAFYAEPTPGQENNTKSYSVIGNELVQFSPIGGKFSASKRVALSGPSGSDIFYTTDGSNPTLQSNKYTGAINVTNTTVLKAIVFSDNALSISPSVETYIITDRDFDLPVISISSDPDNFFDWNTGILADGPNWESNDPHYGANFWEDWERPIYIEYFNADGDKEFEAPGGAKVFGGWSRANDQKSLALFARKAYGTKKFNYTFFDERENDKFSSLVLRNSGNDNGRTQFRDAMMTGLVSEVDIDRQAYQPTITFINGEYWGILNMREKVNEDYLEQNHVGVNANKVDILGNNGWEVIEGSSDHYQNMLNYITNNGLQDDEDYDHVHTLMDVDNFMEYQIAQIYYDNKDWPGNNIKFWRPQMESGRWRWILYDTDFGFSMGHSGLGGGPTYNTLSFALEPNNSGWPNPAWSTFLLRSFVENETFVKEFSNRFADRLNHDFRPDKVVSFIDYLADGIKSEVPYHSARWDNLWDFNYDVDVMVDFSIERPNYMRDYIRQEFGLGSVVNLKVNVADETMGKVQVNSLNLKNYPWSGKYFEDNPLPITAIPEPGYEFSHWEGYSSSAAHIDAKIPSSGMDITAVFKASDKNYNTIVINEINYSSPDTKNSDDWFELFNTTKAALDISGWQLKDSDDANSFIFPKGTIIPAYGYLVTCKDLEQFSEVNPTLLAISGNFKFGLSASFDMIRLYNTQGITVDSVPYFNEQPWPQINENQTISLYTPFSDNSIGSSWQPSEGEGTPGYDNEYFTHAPESRMVSEILKVSCFPNPTIEQSTVRWVCDHMQNIQIDVYNIQGEKVQQVFNGICPSGTFEESIVLGKNQTQGIYFIKINYTLGQTKTLKLVKI